MKKNALYNSFICHFAVENNLMSIFSSFVLK